MGVFIFLLLSLRIACKSVTKTFHIRGQDRRSESPSAMFPRYLGLGNLWTIIIPETTETLVRTGN